MSINSRFRTSEDREINGIVLEYTNEAGEVLAWFKCARPGGRNIEFQKSMSKRMLEFKGQLQDGNQSLYNKILAQVFYDAVILEWGGDIEGKDGENPAELTEENVVWLFTKDCPDLFEDLQSRLEVRKQWQDEAVESAAKNSKTASATNSSGGSKKKAS